MYTNSASYSTRHRLKTLTGAELSRSLQSVFLFCRGEEFSISLDAVCVHQSRRMQCVWIQGGFCRSSDELFTAGQSHVSHGELRPSGAMQYIVRGDRGKPSSSAHTVCVSLVSSVR